MNLSIKTLLGLRKELLDLESTVGKHLYEIQTLLNDNSQYVLDLADCWEGSWANDDYNHYTLPDQRNRLVEVHKAYFPEMIARTKQIDISKLEDEVFELLKPYKSFKLNLVTELSVISDDEKFVTEKDMLSKLEKYQWGFDLNTVLKSLRPNQMIVHNHSMINNGIPNPPHILIQGQWMSLTTKAYSVIGFSEQVTRLLRQLEIKSEKNTSNETESVVELVLKNIFNNFHSFCNQLVDRYNSRNSIIVSDEYDVQDLLHAILKLHFRDVRPEEYSPSYAGSATRMDFLLKDEQIVIEVKKTRKNLDDKEVGSQLILDTAHYANHPDCKRLICFVYDPENRIKNPRGLEKDISKDSADGFGVEVYIRP